MARGAFLGTKEALSRQPPSTVGFLCSKAVVILLESGHFLRATGKEGSWRLVEQFELGSLQRELQQDGRKRLTRQEVWLVAVPTVCGREGLWLQQ